ncbi:hypothetical protein EJ04DRAFT_592434 [Polyplosphaeria fusca]|uniref:Heterokaryon incompatibility domain-containing protein n=1 Tax=Polyplosphaeria fusca TaxID=682080 RepID=A0A9P4UVD2_9PLEO|nr:hypothetical protein EJ04DRAFT_592434 [Polyplosphaeria fusca]
MESVRSESADDDQRFRYQPLANPGSSIRLVEVDPCHGYGWVAWWSSADHGVSTKCLPQPSHNIRYNPEVPTDGTRQIRIFHSALSEEYTCLSYVWGKEDDGGGPFPILVDGKTSHIRCNLHAFLHVARRKYPKRKIWIDAICIDQANTPERNQQVQQMGEIYSRAKEVITWLGGGKTAAEYTPRVSSRARHTFRELHTDIGHVLDLLLTTISGSACFGLCPSRDRKKIVQHAAFEDAVRTYWSRAWVTQEITLTKHVCLRVHETEFDVTALKLTKMRNYRESTIPTQLLELYDANTRDHDSHDRNLIKLLCQYSDKQCHTKRDRIFSLLSMCAEGQGFYVDYNLPEKELLCAVLRTSRLTPCLCSAHIASRSINVDKIPEQHLRARYFVKLTVQAADVYTYHTTQRKWRSCCSGFSIPSFAEQSNGQLFCLANVCPNMKWHLFMWSQEPDQQHVKGVMRKSFFGDTTSLPLGTNGERVDIRPSSLGDSYTISFDLGVLLSLSTEYSFTTLKFLSNVLTGGGRNDWLDLCAM